MLYGSRKQRDPDGSGVYGRNQQNLYSTANTERLRRSFRGTAPRSLTRQDQFENLIHHATDRARSEATLVRQFSMPSFVLAAAQDVLQRKVNPSRIELLPTAISLEIINLLEGNEQIMVALACKTLASVVEASPTRKIANLRDYSSYITMKNLLVSLADRSTDAEFIRRGYARPPSPAITCLEQWTDGDLYSIPYHNEYCAAREQCRDMKQKVAIYLGKEYAWCASCRIFRLLNKNFWLEFAEHESPGILKKSKATKKKIDEEIKNWTSKEDPRCEGVQVARLPKPDTKGARTEDRICPAHALLEERGKGQRVIMEEPAPKPKPKPESAKGAKKGKNTRGRKRKRAWDGDSDDDSD